MLASCKTFLLCLQKRCHVQREGMFFAIYAYVAVYEFVAFPHVVALEHVVKRCRGSSRGFYLQRYDACVFFDKKLDFMFAVG